MAGIYFHIPFCKQACHYCDFHFSTSLQYKNDVLQAMRKEMVLQADYLQGQEVSTLYFGGGSPSILSAEEISLLIDDAIRLFDVKKLDEVTLEANPDDLDTKKVHALRQTQVDRFSIGIQSFFEEDLRWMNRAHTASEAESAVKRVQDAGFSNVTCDLIYGYPLLTAEKWKYNMQTLIDFDVPHISSYSMTVEPKTALDHFIRKGKTPPINDYQSTEHMLMLFDTMRANGYEHYEISNFAKPGCYAVHNTSYWQGAYYLGIGPSAHSYNGHSRQWNVRNNTKYIKSIHAGGVDLEKEELTISDQLNEYVMTSLRTQWGMDMDHIAQYFGEEQQHRIQRELVLYVQREEVVQHENRVTLTTRGKLMADHIAGNLFD